MSFFGISRVGNHPIPTPNPGPTTEIIAARIDFNTNTKTYDTHNCLNKSNMTYTIPVDGIYSITTPNYVTTITAKNGDTIYPSNYMLAPEDWLLIEDKYIGRVLTITNKDFTVEIKDGYHMPINFTYPLNTSFKKVPKNSTVLANKALF